VDRAYVASKLRYGPAMRQLNDCWLNINPFLHTSRTLMRLRGGKREVYITLGARFTGWRFRMVSSRRCHRLNLFGMGPGNAMRRSSSRPMRRFRTDLVFNERGCR
jgi:hypothetical protein